MSTRAGRSKPFTPSRENPVDLAERTVGRKIPLQIIAERLQAAATTNERAHTLIVGPRGAGKSHLLQVAEYQLTHADTVAQKLVLVRTPEDGVGLTRLRDLLQLALRAVDPTPADHDVTPAQLQQRIHDGLQGRVLVLVVENFARVLQQIGTDGQQGLRAWVETSGEVLLLASSPTLDETLLDRAYPWFGGLAPLTLPDLSVDEGRDLLIAQARLRQDHSLVDFLNSQVGYSRVRAIAPLTGGSPRLWMILAEVIAVDTLDALVPAVEELLEQLVGYYQQQLWELAGNEQRIVIAMADPHHDTLAVKQIGELAGIEQRATASTLKRLEKSRWVEPVDRAGDQRRSWYRLREPMLRHHIQYRADNRESLTLIVALLRAWFSEHERTTHLLALAVSSEGSRLLAATWRGDIAVYDGAYADRDPQQLQAEARKWLHREGEPRHPQADGELLDWLITTSKSGSANAVLDDNNEPVRRQLQQYLTEHSDQPWADRIGGALNLLVDSVADCSPGLRLVEAGWNGHSDPARSADRLGGLLESLGSEHPLALDITHEHGYFLAASGHLEEGLALLHQVLEQRMAADPDHPDTLRTQANIAYWIGETGDSHQALSLYTDLLTDRTLNTNHQLARAVRTHMARWHAQGGDISAALAVLEPQDWTNADVLQLFLLLVRSDDGVAQMVGAQEGVPAMAKDLVLAHAGDTQARDRLPRELADLLTPGSGAEPT
ncbi:MAG: tetratricopeptide repeat protein [Beutenbergiaceae bacterium]